MTLSYLERQLSILARYITNSELNCYRECKRKWWLTWYRKLKLNPEYAKPSAATLGSAVHGALEALYKGEDWDAVLTALQDDSEETSKQLDLARVMVGGYIEWLEETGADSNIEFLANEEQIEVPHPDLPVTLMGKLDARIRILEPEGFGFLDFKTVGNLSDIPALADLNDQFKHYSLLMKLRDPDSRFSGGIWRMLRKVGRSARAKPPFYGEFTKLYNEHQLSSYDRQMRGLIVSILRDERILEGGKADPLTVVPPTPHRDCNWKCEFRTVCPMFDDGSRVEEFIEDYYVTINPLEGRYEVDPSV